MTLKQFSDFSEGLSIESLMEVLFYRDEFLSIASHEFKTPLTSLKLQTQVFKRNTSRGGHDCYSKEKVDRLVEQIDTQTDRLTKIVNAMLDVSRIRSGKFHMLKESLNLSALLNETVNTFATKCANPLKIRIENNIFVLGDKNRIEQVILNLLNNALNYGKGNPIEVKLTQRKNKVLLTVADQGLGIRHEDQKRIFNRFQRGIPASEVSGVGLGLFIAKEIIAAHEGKIRIKSELEKGATFLIELKSEDSI